MATHVCTISSKLGETPWKCPGRTAALVAKDLDHFQGVLLLPNVIEQMEGTLVSKWGSEDFLVLRDGEDKLAVHIYYDGDLRRLRRP